MCRQTSCTAFYHISLDCCFSGASRLKFLWKFRIILTDSTQLLLQPHRQFDSHNPDIDKSQHGEYGSIFPPRLLKIFALWCHSAAANKTERWRLDSTRLGLSESPRLQTCGEPRLQRGTTHTHQRAPCSLAPTQHSQTVIGRLTRGFALWGLVGDQPL